MKRVKNLPNRFSKIWLNICKGLLSLLGVSAMASCSEFPFGEVKCEYGSPYASYEIKGKVVDSTNTPIQDIVITLEPHQYYIQSPHYSTTTKTDGTFFLQLKNASPVTDKVYAVDIDGSANGGHFETAEQKLELTKTSDGKDWYQGNYVAKEVTIVLKKTPMDYVQ